MFGLGYQELVILLLLVVPYFIPMIIAMARDHPNRSAIAALNLLAGWSVIGWVAALVWALMSPREKRDDVIGRRPCPHCAEAILPEAKVCRYCGRDVEPLPPVAPPPAKVDDLTWG
jgi:hypothetical protein